MFKYYLNDHKFINALCPYSKSVENSVDFFLHCNNFSLLKQTLIDKDIINEINETDSDLVNILLFGSSKYEYHINH